MIHLFIIFFLCSICIGLIWSCVGLMDKIKRLEMECDELSRDINEYEDRKVFIKPSSTTVEHIIHD